jgi:hypothetical protein
MALFLQSALSYDATAAVEVEVTGGGALLVALGGGAGSWQAPPEMHREVPLADDNGETY